MNTYALINHDLLMVADSPSRTYVLKIKDMPSEDRPREKLRKYGPSALSNQELLAVLLSTGTKKEEVLQMSGRIIKEYGEKALLARTNPNTLAKDLDIPLIKALQIVACGELGKRFYDKKAGQAVLIRTAKDVYNYVVDMHHLSKEHFRGIYLNAHHRIVHDEMISVGTVDSNLVHPREVFKPAIEYGAVAVILVHNHPSGVVKPSQADIDITVQLVAAAKIMGISIVDHVIVAPNSYESININYNS